MPIVINGSGSITGISAGGLPDGIIQAADLASGVGGKILQVKNVTKTDTFSSSLSQYVAASVTGMDLAFTASSTSNRLFFQVNLNICASTNNRPVAFFLVADGTKIDAATGDAAGSRYIEVLLLA